MHSALQAAALLLLALLWAAPSRADTIANAYGQCYAQIADAQVWASNNGSGDIKADTLYCNRYTDEYNRDFVETGGDLWVYIYADHAGEAAYNYFCCHIRSRVEITEDCPSGQSWIEQGDNVTGLSGYCGVLPTEEQDKGLGCPTDPAPEVKEGEKCDSGNPINTSRGNKYQTETDWSGPDLLGFTRHYNSDTNAPTHLLGAQWTNTYTRKIEAQSTAALVTRPDGKRIGYSLVAGQWIPDADVEATLERLQDGSGNLTGWRYRQTDDRQFEDYDALGRLIGITRADGTTVVLIYNGGVTENNPDDYLPTSIVAQDGRTLTLAYDASRRLSTLTDPTGAQIVYQYDASNRLTTVSYPGGASKTYLYNESAYTAGANLPNALTGIVDEKLQRYATFTYRSDGKAVSTEHAGGVEKYIVTYNADGSATIAEPTGASRQRSFVDLFGVKRVSAVAITGAGATQSRSFTFDANARADQTTDEAGVGRDYDYDARGLLTQSVENTANTGATRRTRQTDWHASFALPVESRLYDSSAALPGTLKSRFTTAYNARGQATAACQFDPGNATAMAYVCGSSANAPTGVRQTTTTYCEPADVTAGTCPREGLVISIDGPRTDVADVTTFTYYAADAASCASAPTTCPYRQGDLWKVTNALGQVSEVLAYDGAGRVLSTKDANAVVTDLEYHARGWLTARKVRGTDNGSEVDDAITRLQYDDTGAVTRITEPDGAFVSFTYDAAHRLTDVTDALGNSIHYTLDNAGQRIQEDTKNGGGTVKRTLARVYDTLGRLETLADAYATPTDFSYDALGNVDTVTDALGRVSDNTYDSLGRLTQSIANALGSGNEQAMTSFAYDARDQLLQVTDPKGLNTGYGYSGLGDLTSLVSPDTGTTTYAYNNGGLRTAQTDARNKTANYGYDALGRLISQAVPTAAQSLYFDYDTAQPACQTGETFTQGRLARERYEFGNTVYCYDRRGNLVRQAQTQTNGSTLTVGATYDAAGRLTAMTYPSGAVVTYLRNANGQISRVDAVPVSGGSQVTLVSDASYLPFGPLTTLTYGNGRVLTKAYDQNYGIEAVSDSAASNPLSQDFTLDALGNVTGLSERTDAGTVLSRTFTYDGLDRLTAQTNGAATVEGFAYDATGNRLSKTVGTTTSYTYPTNSHRLSSVGGTARTYDANGNTAAIGTGGSAKNFAFDDRNRLRTMRLGSTLKATYRYDAQGRRIGKVDAANPSADSRQYTYDAAGHLLGEYTRTGVRLKEYVWLDDMLIAVLSDHDGSTYQLVETDHLGTPRAVVHPAQNAIVWRWDLNTTAFGEHAPSENPDANGLGYTLNLRYPGQYFDAESGLFYNVNRDYDAGTGRYIESDPIGLAGGISTYGYVGGNPIGATDPMGLLAKPAPMPVPTPQPGAPIFDFGPPANSPVYGPGAAAGISGSTCAAIVVAIVSPLVPGNFLEGNNCSDDPRRERKECQSDDDKCARAVSDARRIYGELTTRSIPQYVSASRHGAANQGHYLAILEGQKSLRNAIRRVRANCKTLPPELPSWERLANQKFPVRH